MDTWVERAIGEFSSLRDGETLGLEHHIQWRQTVVHILDAALRWIAQFVDYRAHGLRVGRNARDEEAQRYGLKPASKLDTTQFHNRLHLNGLSLNGQRAGIVARRQSG